MFTSITNRSEPSNKQIKEDKTTIILMFLYFDLELLFMICKLERNYLSCEFFTFSHSLKRDMEELPATKGATIDQALEKCGFGKYNVLLLLFAGLTLFNTVLEAMGISYILPIVECNFKLTTYQSGLLSAVSFIGIISSSHLIGFLTDIIGRRKIMAPSLFLGFVVTVLSSFAPTFETLFLLRFVNGFL